MKISPIKSNLRKNQLQKAHYMSAENSMQQQTFTGLQRGVHIPSKKLVMSLIGALAISTPVAAQFKESSKSFDEVSLLLSGDSDTGEGLYKKVADGKSAEIKMLDTNLNDFDNNDVVSLSGDLSVFTPGEIIDVIMQLGGYKNNDNRTIDKKELPDIPVIAGNKIAPEPEKKYRLGSLMNFLIEKCPVQDFEKKITSLNDELNTKNNELSAKETSLISIKGNLSAANTNYITYKSALDSMDSTMNMMSIYGPVTIPPSYFTMQNYMVDAANSISDYKGQKKETEDSIATLKEEIANKKGQIDRITIIYNIKKASIPQKQQNSAVAKDNSPKQTQGSASKTATTSQTKQTQNTNSTKKLSDAEMDRLCSARDEYWAAKTNLTITEGSLTMIQMDINNIDSKLRSLNSNLEFARSSLNSQSDIYNDVKGSVYQPTVNSSRMRSQNTVNNYESQISQAQYEKQMKLSEQSRLTSESARLSNRIKELEAEIAKLESKLGL